MLCCFALFVCLTLLASFFLPSHLSFKNMYTCSVCSSSGSDPGSCSPQVEIESGRLLFRRDLSPVADVGLRQDLLDMLLLNYSPVWLRIGLEVCTLHCTCMDLIHKCSYMYYMWLSMTGGKLCGSHH